MTAATEPEPAKATSGPQTYSYKGETVTYVRPATSADMGYRDNAGEQILVHFDDGHEEVAVKAAMDA